MRSPLVMIVAACGLTAALAQTPSHQHYEAPKDQRPGPSGQLAPRLQNLGGHVFPVTISSEMAQQFINQGLRLSYGFNHAEAGRAFAEAARLDPDCAMAYWGQALVLGPNINAPMVSESEPKALEMAQKAVALKPKASEKERAYIDALAKRYSGRAEDRAPNDRAYAVAMRELHQRYPGDLDVATLFAEALMDLRPWDYWTRDGEPHPGTEEAVAVIESVLARDPSHPGACHLYIHLMEPTKNPEKAEAAADRLLTLMPAAGHMVHMPAHIYQRVGRYADSARANELAIVADEDYITQCRAQGIYPLAYYPHNIHFLWSAATMEGRSRAALDAARKTATATPASALKDAPFLQVFLIVPDLAMTRFGKWDDILKQPAPAHPTLFTRGIRHYARAMARIGTGRLGEADKELQALRRIVADPALGDEPASSVGNSAVTILGIALEVAAGELAAERKEFDRALAHLERAVRLEDSLKYTEPPDWHYPVRQSLGAVLLEAGRPAEAETVYWEDLRRVPENGWSLFGLMASLRAQGKVEEAAAVERRFEKAWGQADVKLTASRF